MKTADKPIDQEIENVRHLLDLSNERIVSLIEDDLDAMLEAQFKLGRISEHGFDAYKSRHEATVRSRKKRIMTAVLRLLCEAPQPASKIESETNS